MEIRKLNKRTPNLVSALLSAAAAMCALVLAVGCGGSGSTQPTTTLAATPTLESIPTSRIPTQAQIAANLPADFSLYAYNTDGVIPGGTSTLSQVLAQGKPVVLNFWAGNCPPCRAEMPGLQKMYDQFKSQVVLLGVDVGPFFGLGTHEEAKQLLQQLKITYPTADTSDPNVVPKFRIAGLPSTYFLRPDGTLMKSWTGLLGEPDASRLAQDLVNGTSAG